MFTYPKRKKNEKLSFNCGFFIMACYKKSNRVKFNFFYNLRGNNLIYPLYIRIIRDNVKKYKKFEDCKRYNKFLIKY